MLIAFSLRAPLVSVLRVPVQVPVRSALGAVALFAVCTSCVRLVAGAILWRRPHHAIAHHLLDHLQGVCKLELTVGRHTILSKYEYESKQVLSSRSVATPSWLGTRSPTGHDRGDWREVDGREREEAPRPGVNSSQAEGGGTAASTRQESQRAQGLESALAR